jgi:outer membrane receptor protein involved in Fe transport
MNSQGAVDSFSQELRLYGTDDKLNWLVGLNYATNDVISEENILTGEATNTALLPGGPWINDSITSLTQDITDSAIFANIEYGVTESVTLLAGARYAENENDSTSCLHYGDAGMLASFAFFSDVLRGMAPGNTQANPQDCLSLDRNTLEITRTPHPGSLKEDNVSWRLGINYDASDDLLLYGLVSEGYKTGSFALIPASTTAQFDPVTQESVLVYELGFKWSLLEKRLQFNGAIFDYEYKDKQVRGIIKDPVFNQLDKLVNIPKSSIQGAEFDIVWSPIQSLTARLAGTYIDSEVKEYNTFFNVITQMDEFGINGVREQGDFSGSNLPFTPEKHLTADIDYRTPLSANMEFYAGVSVLYNSEANSTFGNPEMTRITDFTTVDMRIGVSAPDGKWSLGLWGKNITDEYYWSSQFITQDVLVRYSARPATYGLAFNYRFDN